MSENIYSIPSSITNFKVFKFDNQVFNKIPVNLSLSPRLKVIHIYNDNFEKITKKRKIDVSKCLEIPSKTLSSTLKESNLKTVSNNSPRGLLFGLMNLKAKKNKFNITELHINKEEPNIRTNFNKTKLPKLRNYKKVSLSNNIGKQGVFRYEKETKLEIIRNFSKRDEGDTKFSQNFQDSPKKENKHYLSSHQVKNMKFTKISQKTQKTVIDEDENSPSKSPNTILFNKSNGDSKLNKINISYEAKNIKSLSITSKHFSKRNIFSVRNDKEELSEKINIPIKMLFNNVYYDELTKHITESDD